MRGTCLLLTLWTLAPAGTLARPVVPRECEALEPPTRTEVQGYLEKEPYRRGFRALVEGRERDARRDLEAAWRRVQETLRPFAGDSCHDQALREALRRTVFVVPPLAIPGEDRFHPPPVVTRAIGVLRCRSGDLRGAALWMLEHGDPTDPVQRHVTASWLEAAGFREAARAIVGGSNR